MLLSASDKSRFIILYRELSNKELAKVFNTNERVVIQIAKDLGVSLATLYRWIPAT
mgnify:CR=1 FL=1